MATPIKIKRSAVSGKRPQLTDLQLGELALNTNDGSLFTERDTGGVGIATTVSNLTPWTESYGASSISYLNSVGIGTDNPQSILDVKGHTRLDDTSIAGVVTVSGAVIASVFGGSGYSLTNLNASNIGFGTVADARISTLTASKLTGALPAISGASLTDLTGVSAGTYGNSTVVPQIDVDANGRITGITNVSIAGGGGGGSSLIIKDSGSLVGTAGTIDFGSNLSVSPLSSGIVTVTGSASGIAGIDTTGTSFFNQLYVTGIGTIGSGGSGYAELQYQGVKKLETTSDGVDVFNIIRCLGGTAPRIQFFGDVNGVDTNTRATFGLSTGANQIVHGTTTNDVALNTPRKFFIGHASTEVMAKFDPDGPVQLYHDNVKRLETTGIGATVFGQLDATTLSGTLQTAAQPNVTSLGTLSSLNVTGVTTMSGALTLSNDFTINGESPAIFFTDTVGTPNDPDYKLQVNNARFILHDQTNNVTRFQVKSNGTVDVSGNLDVGAGIDITGDVIASGNLSAVDGTFTGNVSIGGTLTYEDVTNIDSIGLITARSGVDVNAGGINIDGGGLNITGFSTFNSQVGFSTHVKFNDSAEAQFGDNADLKIYHTGDHSYIQDTGTGNLVLDTNGFAIKLTYNDSETMLRAIRNQEVELYYDNGIKFQTTKHGAKVTGILTATSFSGSGADITGISTLNITNYGVGLGGGGIAGINTEGTSFFNQLSVSGVSTFAGDLSVAENIVHTGDTDTKINFPPAGNIIRFHTNGEERVRIGQNGSVGLGTNNPEARVDIYDDNTSIAGLLQLSQQGTGDASINFQLKGAQEWTIGVDNSDSDKFKISSTAALGFNDGDAVAITTAGNVSVAKDLDVDGHTNLDNLSVAGVSTFTGDATFIGNVSIGGTLTYEDVKNVDAVGLITARSGIRVLSDVIEAQAGENKIPSLYADLAALPSASTYHGMFAHVHATGRGYFAHAGNWLELVNKDTSGNVGLSGDLDVDGHTNLDNVSIVGVATVTGSNINIEGGSASLSQLKINSTGRYRGIQLDENGTRKAHFQHDATDNKTIVGTAEGTLQFNSGDTGRIILNSSGHWVPMLDSTYDLGLTGTRFRNVYADTLYGDGSNLTGISGVSTTVGTFTIGAGSTANIDSFAHATNDYKVAEYTLHFMNGANIQAQKLLVMQDGTNVYSNSYGVMASSNPLVSVGSTIDGTNVYVNVTAEVGVSGVTTYRWRREVQE